MMPEKQHYSLVIIDGDTPFETFPFWVRYHQSGLQELFDSWTDEFFLIFPTLDQAKWNIHREKWH